MTTSEKNRSEDWKDKYFKILIELDEQESKQSEQIARLSRDLIAVLSRLRGYDPAFDRDLDAVRNSSEIHDDAAQTRLRKLVDAAERLALEPPAMEAAVKAVHDQPSLHVRMQQLTAAIEVSEDLRLQVERVREQLGEIGEQVDDAELVSRIAASLSDIFAGLDTKSARDARDVVQGLIDHLSLPASAHAGLAKLTAKLQAADDVDAIRAFAKELGEFLVKYANSLQGEVSDLNDFLLEIKQQLGAVFDHVEVENGARAQAATARAQLDRSLKNGLDDLRLHIDEASDVEQLKRDIQKQLAAIGGNVSSFLDSEYKRAAKADKRTQALTAAIKELAEESEKLRSKLQNARRRAVRDPLTGLPNRLAYNERLRSEYARFQRSGENLSVAVLDIDKFKSINDTFGHQAGDRVLKHLSRELGSQIRRQDFFGRFGGEEFVLILPDTDRDGAVRMADLLRSHIESCRFKHKDEPVHVTISCGIAQFGSGESPDAVFERADAGLYAAKNNGRNRCEALPPPS